MSIGAGVLTLYGSYRKKTEDILKISLIIPMLVCLCGVISAIVVFSYLGYISNQIGVPIDELKVNIV